MTAHILSHPVARALMSLPLPGLLIGWGVVVIGGLIPPVVTFGIVWMVIFCAAPFAILAQIAGAGQASAAVGFGFLLALHLILFHAPLVAGIITRRHLLIVSGLNTMIVGWALLLGGWIAVQRMGEAWPG